ARASDDIASTTAAEPSVARNALRSICTGSSFSGNAITLCLAGERVNSCCSRLAQRLLNLRRAQIARVRPDGPAVPERIFQLRIPVPPEHVLQGHGDLCARGDGLLHRRVGV